MHRAYRFLPLSILLLPCLSEAQRSLPSPIAEVLKLQRQAMNAQSEGKSAEAVGMLKNALAIQPQDPRIHIQLGDLYLESGQKAEALESYQWVVYLSAPHWPIRTQGEKKIMAIQNPPLSAPKFPGPGALTFFDDRWASATNVSHDGPGARVEFDFRDKAFGENSLRVDSMARHYLELTIDFRKVFENAPLAVRKAILDAPEKGAIQFWFKADYPAGSLEFQLGSGRPYVFTVTPSPTEGGTPTATESYTPTPAAAWKRAEEKILGLGSLPSATPDPYGGETDTSWWVSSQNYVIADSTYQEVLIPIKDFGPWNLDWAHMVRYFHIRFPSKLHGSVYHLDEIRVIPEFSEEKVKAMKKKRDAVVKARMPQDPAVWFFRDGVLEPVQMRAVATPTADAGGLPGAGGGPSVQIQRSGQVATPESINDAQLRRENQYLASKGIGAKDISYKDADSLSYLVMDETQKVEGRRSVKVDADTHVDVNIVHWIPETDLTPWRKNGCLHFSIKGKLGGEIVKARMRSRHDAGDVRSNFQDLRLWTKEVSTSWQHVSIPLADFGSIKGGWGGSFEWDRVTGVLFTLERSSASSNILWIDSVWCGSCSPHPVPPEPNLPAIPTPTRPPPPKIELAYRFVLPSDLAFDSGKAILKPEALPEFRAWAANLKNLDPWPSLTLVGHTDNQPLSAGSPFADNQALSLARALSVRDFLAKDEGYKPELLTVRGAGDSQPLSDNSTEKSRGANRRVEVLVEGSLLGSLKESAQLGDHALAQGCFNEAWDIYSKIAGAAPHDPEIWYRLAVTAEKAGSPEKAKEALNRMKLLLGAKP